MQPIDIPGVYKDPEIQGGQPVVETGIPIALILDMLAQGFPPQEMLDDYGITAEHIRLALQFQTLVDKRFTVLVGGQFRQES